MESKPKREADTEKYNRKYFKGITITSMLIY